MLCQNTLFRFFSLIRRTDSFLILIDTARIISCLLYTSSSPSSGGISGANSSEAEEPCHCHVLGVTPPRRGLQDTDTATGSRNLLLELTSCQGKGSSEPQGLRSSWADPLQTPGMTVLGLVLLREHQPREILWAPVATVGRITTKTSLFSTNLCFHQLHTGLKTPDLSWFISKPNTTSQFNFWGSPHPW